MARPSITWLVADTHWHHDAMVELCGRPPNFNELILRNLRYVLAPQDLLVHLGDVILYQYQTLKAKLDSIAGTKVLLMGNHDRRSPGWYMRNGFVFASDMIVIGDVLFSHRPVEQLPVGVRLNIHGHWHNADHRQSESYQFWKPETHRCLSLEKTEYKPVRLVDFAR